MADSKIAVYGAIAANVAIAVTKFIVAAITGSSAMLSEGIHSAVDTGNGVLLLIGTRLSEREATPEHPFGHGKELFFWSLIGAVLIFGLGGGLSIFEGVQHVVDPVPMRDPKWNSSLKRSIKPGNVLRIGRAWLPSLRRRRMHFCFRYCTGWPEIDRRRCTRW